MPNYEQIIFWRFSLATGITAFPRHRILECDSAPQTRFITVGRNLISQTDPSGLTIFCEACFLPGLSCIHHSSYKNCSMLCGLSKTKLLKGKREKEIIKVMSHKAKSSKKLKRKNSAIRQRKTTWERMEDKMSQGEAILAGREGSGWRDYVINNKNGGARHRKSKCSDPDITWYKIYSVLMARCCRNRQNALYANHHFTTTATKWLF